MDTSKLTLDEESLCNAILQNDSVLPSPRPTTAEITDCYAPYWIPPSYGQQSDTNLNSISPHYNFEIYNRNYTNSSNDLAQLPSVAYNSPA